MIGTKLLQAGAVSKEGYVLEGGEGKRKKMRRKRRRNRKRKRRWWQQQLVVVLAMIAAKWYWQQYILRLTSRFFSFYLEIQRGRNLWYVFKSGESDFGVKNAQKYHLGGPQWPWMSIFGDFWLLRLFQYNFGKMNNLKPIH